MLVGTEPAVVALDHGFPRLPRREIRLLGRLNAQLIAVSMVAAEYDAARRGRSGVVKQVIGWVCSRKVLSAPRGCQRLGRVGSANCRPGRPFLGAMRARQV